MVGWHYLLNAHEFEQALGVGDFTEKPAALKSMEWQRVGQDLVTEQQTATSMLGTQEIQVPEILGLSGSARRGSKNK